jgi:Zn-dependent protease
MSRRRYLALYAAWVVAFNLLVAPYLIVLK